MTRLEFVEAVEKVRSTGSFEPEVSPACANFASTMLRKLGKEAIPQINYVPDYFKYYYETSEPQPGDLIIFDQTYDAVPPSGIGPEDDKTHVGIVDKSGVWGNKGFFHYSNSQGRVAWQSDWSDSYWGRFPHKFLRTHIGDEPAAETRVMKMFYNEGRLSVVVDGKTYQPKSMTLEVKY